MTRRLVSALALTATALAATASAGTGGVEATPDLITFSFSGYGNPQRPFPGYVGTFQLGPVRISGSGEIRGSNGAVVRGGYVSHTDNLRDRRYPNHSTTWRVVRGLSVKSAGTATVLRLQVQVTSSNYPDICPVGTLGVLQVVDDTAQIANGQSADYINTTMPSPSSRNSRGTLACGTHTHGFNNVDYSWTDPPRGGPGGGIYANVTISGQSTSTFSGKWRAYGRLAGFGYATLSQSGSRVTGTYDWSGGGTVEGSVDASGKRFTGTWRDTTGTYTIIAVLNGKGFAAQDTSGNTVWNASCVEGACLNNR